MWFEQYYQKETVWYLLLQEVLKIFFLVFKMFCVDSVIQRTLNFLRVSLAVISAPQLIKYVRETRVEVNESGEYAQEKTG